MSSQNTIYSKISKALNFYDDILCKNYGPEVTEQARKCVSHLMEWKAEIYRYEPESLDKMLVKDLYETAIVMRDELAKRRKVYYEMTGPQDASVIREIQNSLAAVADVASQQEQVPRQHNLSAPVISQRDTFAPQVNSPPLSTSAPSIHQVLSEESKAAEIGAIVSDVISQDAYSLTLLESIKNEIMVYRQRVNFLEQKHGKVCKDANELKDILTMLDGDLKRNQEIIKEFLNEAEGEGLGQHELMGRLRSLCDVTSGMSAKNLQQCVTMSNDLATTLGSISDFVDDIVTGKIQIDGRQNRGR